MATPPPPAPLLIGVDVGTGSARAGVFDATGRLLATAARPIQIYRVEGQPLLYQQAGEGIWRALCAAAREALAGVAEGRGGQKGRVVVAALSVTATCSMVVMREGGRVPADVTPPGARGPPLPLAGEGEGEREGEGDVPNIIMWLDHRALAEAEAISGTGHPMLRHVGGKVSPENEVGLWFHWWCCWLGFGSAADRT